MAENTAIKEAFEYQIEILKKEIDIINQSMTEIIKLTQTIKNWAITVWIGSIAFALDKDLNFEKYVILTAIPPLLFWYADAYWRSLQTRYAFRASKISNFLNSDDFSKSFKKKELINIKCFDTTGRSYRGESEYKKYTSLRRTMRMPEVINFYLPLSLISLGIGTYFLLKP